MSPNSWGGENRGAPKGAGNEARIKELDQQLSTLGDDAQHANIDVQDWLQKNQQTLQTMSHVSKLLHDTGLAVIRKID